MKTKFKGKNFNLSYSDTLARNKALFIDLHGNSSGCIAPDEKSLMNFYSELINASRFVGNLVRELEVSKGEIKVP